MNRENQQAAILLGFLVVFGALAWALSLRPAPLPAGQELNALPAAFNDWNAVDVEMDASVTDMLRADANVQRAYFHPLGYSVFVYVGYYGTERGGVPEHTPDICYPAQGWTISSEEDRQVGGANGHTVREMVVTKDEEQRLVHFWYRTRDQTGITSTTRLQVSQFWGRLVANRGDGALVRISTAILDGDLASARGKLLAFDQPVDASLADVWPVEQDQPAS